MIYFMVNHKGYVAYSACKSEQFDNVKSILESMGDTVTELEEVSQEYFVPQYNLN